MFDPQRLSRQVQIVDRLVRRRLQSLHQFLGCHCFALRCTAGLKDLLTHVECELIIGVFEGELHQSLLLRVELTAIGQQCEKNEEFDVKVVGNRLLKAKLS